MATIDVKDAADATVEVELPNANGRAGAAASRPVALSTEDKTTLDSIDTKLDALATKIDGRSLTEPLGQPSVARKITVTAASASVTLTTDCRRVSMEAVGCNQRYVVGTGAQTANASTSHWLAVGTRLDIAVPANAVIAAIRDNNATTDGVLEFSELI